MTAPPYAPVPVGAVVSVPPYTPDGPAVSVPPYAPVPVGAAVSVPPYTPDGPAVPAPPHTQEAPL
ncbi:hypothetical protein EV562_11097 [Streptomyces sp. BK208]|uniref:hypothetical protein n=1 Tax=Streptomyces sp. BK208 TaxID=2512150 RepID=UPI00106239EB|nr:hypothetical protein [Streptomyces sp. BK208]TDT32243.1 hypothetical protein EV562_11097 [Streptomyces sp. BK208]